MKQNISIVDRYARLVTGILALNYVTGSSRKQAGRGLMLSLGAMKVAEGITGWCPATQLYDTFFSSRQNNPKAQKQQQDQSQHKDSQQNRQHSNHHHSQSQQSQHEESQSNEAFEIQ